jgi:ectoine hydrolase
MVPLPFSKEEYRTRLARLRACMQDKAIELLVVTDVANQYYLTAYDGWSFYTPQVVLVPLADEDPVWIGRAMDAAGGQLTVWMARDRVIGYPESLVQQDDRHPMDWIGNWIVDRGWGRLRTAVELDSYYYSPKAHARLAAALPNARLVDAGLIVNWLRAEKSPAEIAYMRKAARIAETTMQAAYAVIAPGVRECDAVASIYQAQMAGQSEFSGDITALPPTILGGENAAAPHILWSERRFGADEIVALELAGACRHYTAGLARTMQLGTASNTLTRTAAAVLEGMDAVLDTIKPGVSAEAVELAWRRVIERHGLKKESRIGYAMGIGYPPDWGEHTISLRAGDRTLLAENHTLHCILGMWMDQWGLEISETILVTKDGAECLTSLPRAVHRK